MMMRNLIMWNMVSLDGRFEGANQTIDWFAFDDELEQYILDTQMSAGTLLFGRVTYQMMAAHWPSAEGEIADFMNSVPKVVASRTLETVEWNNTRLVNENVPDEVSKLKQEPGKDVFLFGSANLASTLMQHGLIDEFRLGVNPVVLGVARRCSKTIRTGSICSFWRRGRSGRASSSCTIGPYEKRRGAAATKI